MKSKSCSFLSAMRDKRKEGKREEEAAVSPILGSDFLPPTGDRADS